MISASRHISVTLIFSMGLRESRVKNPSRIACFVYLTRLSSFLGFEGVKMITLLTYLFMITFYYTNERKSTQ